MIVSYTIVPIFQLIEMQFTPFHGFRFLLIFNGSIKEFWFYVYVLGIKRTLEYLNDEGYFCKGYVVDIADKEQVYETAKIVRTEIGPVDILINNAGIVRCKPLWQLEDNSIEKTYSVNILSHYWVCKFTLN